MPGEFDLFAPRVPAKPVPLSALAFEQAEWGGHREVEAPLPIASDVVAHSPTPSIVSTAARSKGDGKKALAA